MTKPALVVLSGGQDSTTCLYWARLRFDPIHTLTFDYGQRHSCELNAAHRISIMAGAASHQVVRAAGLLHSVSPLTDPSASLETYTDYAAMDAIIGDRVELTFVPMRNLLFLTVAANRALALGAKNIITGICEADNANYPDCRDVFAHSAETTINLALGVADAIQIHTPLMHRTKAQTVSLAHSIPGCMDALAYSHTCYAGTYPPCGECHACVLRAHGFSEAGIADPLITRAATETLVA